MAHYWVFDTRRCGLVPNLNDIVYPLVVLLKRVSRDTNHFNVSLQELRSPRTRFREYGTDRTEGIGHAHRCEMSASSVVHTGVKSPGCENRMA